MPELPEVETVVRRIAPRITGARVVRARFLSARVAKCPPRVVEGRRVLAVRRQGKHILWELDDGNRLCIHLGMTGKLLLDGEPGPHTRAVFEFECGPLLFDDMRMFGRIQWNRDLSALGPDALTVGLEEFLARLSRRKTQIKPLLLDQKFICGVGNIYADEALFRARIHPLATASRLSRARAARLHAAVIETLELGILNCGSSISDFVDALGNPGHFQDEHLVYGRTGEPCASCGRSIRRILVAQRGTHFCPRCQRR